MLDEEETDKSALFPDPNDILRELSILVMLEIMLRCGSVEALVIFSINEPPSPTCLRRMTHHL